MEEPSPLVARGAVMSAFILTRLDNAVKKRGGTSQALTILARSEGQPLIDTFAASLVEAELKTRRKFLLRVDTERALEDLVGAGEYDDVDELFTSDRFPLVGSGIYDVEVTLVSFPGATSSDEAIEELEGMGLEPCTIGVLLTLGAAYKLLQTERPIIGLGSSPLNTPSRLVPYLGFLEGMDRKRRKLGLHTFDHSWRQCLFAANPKRLAA